jgi:hypothetical protein
MTVCIDATNHEGAVWLQGASRCTSVTTSDDAQESALEAGGVDQRRRSYGPKGQRSGSPMLERW